MSQRNDAEYFRRRIAQEQHRARAAVEGPIRRLHLDLASRYAEQVAEAERLAMPSVA